MRDFGDDWNFEEVLKSLESDDLAISEINDPEPVKLTLNTGKGRVFSGSFDWSMVVVPIGDNVNVMMSGTQQDRELAAAAIVSFLAKIGVLERALLFHIHQTLNQSDD